MIRNKLNQRIVSLDLLKTIAIFGVVFIHCRSGLFSEVLSQLFRIAVPIFIIFFIYFLEKSYSKTSTIKEGYLLLLDKFKALFFPYIFFTIFYFFILNDLSSIKLTDLITGYWSGYGWSGQYFFIILFQLLIFYPILRVIVKFNITVLSILSILFYITMSYLFWSNNLVSSISDRFFIYWIPYVFLGILLSRNVNNSKKYSHNLFLLSIFLIPLEFYIFNTLSQPHSPYVLSSVLISSSIISFYFLANNEKINNYIKGKIELFSIYVSKRSLGIFALNPLFVFLLKPYYEKIQFENELINFITVIIFSIIVFLCCLITIELLSKTYLKKMVVN
jgi:surface polysaccharide O-acyltransferase-like enzyme